MTYSIKHLFHINAPREKVFEAISTINGLTNWWTVETTGNASVGGVIKFRFSTNGGPDMKVTSLISKEKVTWECLESNHGWKGHTFEFYLDENDGKTRVRFVHDGWNEQNDFYAICCFSWGRYMESLRQYCQTGKGEAFGSAGYRT
jgi:uncharacterized protein YndB with AHSA1/START domain